MKSIEYEQSMRSIVFKGRREGLPSPPRSSDHASHVAATAMAGYAELASDHLLNREMKGRLDEVVGDVIRQLNLEFVKGAQSVGAIDEGKVRSRQMAYEVLAEIAMNLYGIEGAIVGLSDEEVAKILGNIAYALATWEDIEGREGSPIGRYVVERYLGEMRKVFSGGGMVAKMGDEIRQKMQTVLVSEFVKAAGSVVQENIYFVMAKRRACKFGNDYAIGLRWLRHLGYVQVSTNPVLAARAYDDDPGLMERFVGETMDKHAKWKGDLHAFGDDIAMQATMVALWPNLAVFKPIASLTDYHDGMVSYQLNPNVASSLEGSMSDALKIYSAAQDFLRKYDEYLLWGYSVGEERGRPNIVFKIAGGYPAAVEITSSLNSLGIGTNNTVTYTVAQEATLIMAAMKGMAEAVRKGITPTQIYETNMGGRLESHLREVEVERLVVEALRDLGERRDALLLELAKGLNASVELEATVDFQERVRKVCSFRYLKSLVNETLIDTMASAKGVSREEVRASMTELEGDIGMAGTLVAQRTFWIFFSPENWSRWREYLEKRHGLTPAEADMIIDRIDMLPASKRKPNDTYLTLASRNMTNTEFPDHQYRVLVASRQGGFSLSAFENSIAREHDKGIIRRLLLLEDFRRAYELTPELGEKLESLGILGDHGRGGLKASEWPTFGSVVKTVTEFTNAYDAFKAKCVEAIRAAS